MTSTTYNRYADPATDESKTESFNESLGGTNALKRKSLLIRVSIGLNDLLPRSIRPIKSKRSKLRRGVGWRMQVLAFRINWRAIYKNKLLTKLGIREHGK
jgi:hypothetical protein